MPPLKQFKWHLRASSVNLYGLGRYFLFMKIWRLCIFYDVARFLVISAMDQRHAHAFLETTSRRRQAGRGCLYFKSQKTKPLAKNDISLSLRQVNIKFV